MSDNKTSEDRMVELLGELVKWIKVTSIPQVKVLLEDLLKTPEEKLAYPLRWKKDNRELSRLSGIDISTLSKDWRKWTRAGIAEPIAVAGGGNRARSLFSLEEFGIEVPNIPQASNEKNEFEEQDKTIQQTSEVKEQ
jgi:hypothetical protein